MLAANTPLFETECFGAVIAYVQVFATHIAYKQRSGSDISVPMDIIVSAEEHLHEHGFVILRPATRRPIICMVYPPERASALCTAIRNAHITSFSAKEIKA